MLELVVVLGRIDATLKGFASRSCKVSENQEATRDKDVKGYALRMGLYHGVWTDPLMIVGSRKSHRTLKYYMEHTQKFQYAMDK